MIEKILVAIDGSKNAYKALEYAIRLSMDYGAELLLLTVVPDFKPKCDEESAYQKMLTERAESYLDSAKEEVEESNQDIKFETEIVFGDPAEKIITIADKKQVDLIVLGSRGLSGVSRWVLGSVSDRVSDYAHCTVLIAK
jgi:nucleotide-binding universal stress UspA family protein